MERSLLRKCIVMCYCNSQCYTFLFSVLCANTVSWKSSMGYFWMQWSLRRLRRYPQLKTRKKLSQKLLRDAWMYLTELHLCFLQQSILTLFVEPEKDFFGSHWGLRWQRTHHEFKTWKKLSGKLLCDLWISLTDLQLSSQEAVCKHSSRGICKVRFGSP